MCNPGWTPAIRTGSLQDGSSAYLIDGTEANPEGLHHVGVAVDPQGNVYVRWCLLAERSSDPRCKYSFVA